MFDMLASEYALFMTCLIPWANSSVGTEHIANSQLASCRIQSFSDLFVSGIDRVRRIASDNENAMDAVFEGRDPIVHIIAQETFRIGALPKGER